MEDSALPPLLGILGHQIAGNPMQFAMERVLTAAGLDWRFLSFDISPDKLQQALGGLDALGFRGLAIATPHARHVAQWIEHVSPDATASGWIDTISRNSDGEFVGHHASGQVFCDWLGTEIIEGAIALVLGDSENTEKGVALAELLTARGLKAVQRQAEDLAQIQILIRGATTNQQPVSFSEAEVDRLPENAVVVDLATSAGTSPLLRFSAARGLRTLSSIDLMELRSMAAFELWTGRAPDRNLLREAYEEYLEI
jgi:shikimate dehydrogenase